MNNPATLKQLFDDNKQNKIVLPDFQRPLEWDQNKQRRLLASCLVDLSIGSLLFLEGNESDFPARKIGIAKSAAITPNTECYYLLDGQQRLTSIRSFFSDFFDDVNWTDTWESIFPQLRVRWFLRLKPLNKGNDIFGYEKLRFENRMSVLEPDSIFHLIESKQLYKTKIYEWWHPGFNKKGDDNTDITAIEFESHCASEHLIPLYKIPDILKDKNNNVIRRIVKRISEAHRADIDTKLAEFSDEVELKKFILDLLGVASTKKLSTYSTLESIKAGFKDEFDNLRADWQADVFKYFESLWEHKTNLMILSKEQVARAIAIFTAINEGGQKLSTFDLIVAKAAKDGTVKSLPERIKEIAGQYLEIPQSINIAFSSSNQKWQLSQTGAVSDNAIEKWFQDSFINLISGLSWSGYKSNEQNFVSQIKLEHFKADKQLSLTYVQINENADLALKALQRAFAFLQFRCGIVSGSDLNYLLMALPIAFVLLKDEIWQDPDAINKLESWYWISMFSGSYREGQNERSYNDVKLLYNWLSKKPLSQDESSDLKRRKDQMFIQTNYCDEQTFVQNEDSVPVPKAMHDACLQYVLSTNPPDFLPEDKWEKVKLYPWAIAQVVNLGIQFKGKKKDTTEEPVDLNVSDHHIFPLGCATRIGESSKKLRAEKKHPLNSPMNRTYISKTANLLISDETPSTYLPQIMGIAKDFHFVTEHQVAEFSSPTVVFFRGLLKERFTKFSSAVKTEIENLNP